MPQFDNVIDGEQVAADEYAPNVNPSDVDDIVGYYARGGRKDVERAVAAARRAFGTWSVSTPQQRFDVLDEAGGRILSRRQELATLLAREEGKPIAEALGEVVRAGYIFKFFAGEALRLTGDVVPSVRPEATVEITREPLGVVGLITPWNFPLAIPAWKLAPALAFGNTVVLKPADLVPGSVWQLVKILEESGLPPGVLNLVMGRGSVVGDALVTSPDVDAISFTGSVATGRALTVECVGTGKRVQAEMGGKNPMVVLDDADLRTAVDACVSGAYFSTGQRCTASSRFIVTDGIHDAFVEAVAGRLSTLKVGHALDADTIVGPVVDQSQLDQDLSYLSVARSDGGEVLGGELIECRTQGFYLAPALVTGTTNDMRINREEVFGPVASVVRVADYEAALAAANDTEFGLSAGICSSSLKYVTHFKRHARAGMVMVNAPTAGVDYHVPFGGTKASSYGPREQGSYAREFYTTVKTAYVFPG
jgi:aldehyde dehydrogenase (NAD+)